MDHGDGPPPVGVERLPPQNLDAERDVLGALLVAPDPGITRAREVLQGDPDSVWYMATHASIWRAILQLEEANRPVDLLTVADGLRRAGVELDVVYLHELAGRVVGASNVEAHARLVMEAARARYAMRLGQTLLDAAYANRDLPAVLGATMDGLYQLQTTALDRGGWRPLEDGLGGALEAWEEARQRGDGLTGLSWGIAELDRLTAGLQPADLILLGARPSTGKTALAGNIARHVAKSGTGVGIVSLEMSLTSLGQRWLATSSGVALQDVRTGRGDVSAMARSAAAEAQAPVWIDDTPGLTEQDVRARARALVRRHGAGLIVVDYLQLVEASQASESTEREVSRISRVMKATAKELNVPVLALCQLSRAPTQRTDKRPMLSDLRYSGSLEQDADVVMFLHREAMFMSEEKAREKGLTNVAELLIAKQRQGPLATVKLVWDGPAQAFRPAAPDWYEERPLLPPSHPHEPREREEGIRW